MIFATSWASELSPSLEGQHLPPWPTHSFIHKFYREKLPFPSGIAPGTDLTFVGDTGTNSPPKNQTDDISVYSLSYLE